jgi:hypothetical protein
MFLVVLFRNMDSGLGAMDNDAKPTQLGANGNGAKPPSMWKLWLTWRGPLAP